MNIGLTYHPRGPRERLARLTVAAAFLAFAAKHARPDEPSRYGRPEACTVMIGGCSGICVSPEGHVLTAGHCDCESGVEVIWKDGRRVKATKVYDTGKPEGVEVFDCEGAGYPYMPISPRPPRPGDRVFSYGYPVNQNGVAALKYGSGVLDRSDLSSEYKGEAVYFNITSDLGCMPGWSGGPLFNDRSEVIGVCHGYQREVFPIVGQVAPIPGVTVGQKENAFVAWSLVREACEATIAPPETLTVYIWPKGCGHCERFKKDCEAVDLVTLTGTFAGMPVQFRYTAGAAPRFAINGYVKEGYAGKADLLTWVQKCRTPKVVEQPVPQRPRADFVPVPDYEPEPIVQWQRREEQRRKSVPIPPAIDYGQPVSPPGYCPPGGCDPPGAEPQVSWDGVRLIACFRLDFDGFLPLRGLGAAKAEELLEKVCDERGLPVRLKIVSRSLNPEAYDRFADSVGGLERIQIVALVPEDADKSGIFKSIIIRKIESVAESYLEGTALKVLFERTNESQYTAAVNAVMSYTNVPGSEGEPFKLGEAGIVAILTRRLRIAEGLKNLVMGWVKKTKGDA